MGSEKTVGEPLRRLIAQVSSETGMSTLAAITLIGDELSQIGRDAVEAARREGVTWQKIAEDLNESSRQWAQAKFGDEVKSGLPGMSAAAMARRIGIHQQTVAAHPERHGIIVKTYAAAAGSRGRKRYFLPGDEDAGPAPR